MRRGLCTCFSAVCRRWFPRTSIGVLVVLDVMLFVAGGGIILARTPSMYFMPEAMSLALVSWGLGLWVSGTSRGYIERGKIVLGALLIALTMASRPQMVLSAVLGLVLFSPCLATRRAIEGLRRDVMGAFKVAMVPFVLVAVAVLAYNAARFGSPFDFGANYNLPANDITGGFHLDRIPFGLYAYLFQPPVFGSQFPFLRQAYLDPAYQGITIYEPMFGGYFFLYPMALAVLGIVIGRVRAQLIRRSDLCRCSWRLCAWPSHCASSICRARASSCATCAISGCSSHWRARLCSLRFCRSRVKSASRKIGRRNSLP